MVLSIIFHVMTFFKNQNYNHYSIRINTKLSGTNTILLTFVKNFTVKP